MDVEEIMVMYIIALALIISTPIVYNHPIVTDDRQLSAFTFVAWEHHNNYRAEPVTVVIPASRAISCNSTNATHVFSNEIIASDNIYAYVEDTMDGNTSVAEYIQIEFPDLSLVPGVEIQSVYIVFEHHEVNIDCGKLGNQVDSPINERPDDLELWNGSSWIYIGDYTLKDADTNATTNPSQTKNVVLLSEDPIYVINHMKLRVYIGNDSGTNVLYIDSAYLFVTYIPYKPPIIVSGLEADPPKVTVYSDFKTTLRATFTDENNGINDFMVTIALRGPGNERDIYYLAINNHSGQGPLTITELDAMTFELEYEYDPPDSMPEGLYDLYLLILDGEGGKAVDSFENNDDDLFIVHDTIPVLESITANPASVNKNGTRTTTISMVIIDNDTLLSDFIITLKLRHEVTGKVYTLLDNATNAAEGLTITAIDYKTFNASYIFDPEDTYEDGSYSAYVWISDGVSYSEYGYHMNLGIVNIYYAPNTPPEPPTEILPMKTANQKPLITWNEGYDADGDPLWYEIRIGTATGMDDVIGWTSTGKERRYQVITTLNFGIYFVAVRAFDGMDYSQEIEVTMEIVSDNTPPGEVAFIYPNVTSEESPRIWWSPAYDPDGDSLRYEIRIGTYSGGDDVLEWTNVGYSTEYYPTFSFTIGTYYVAVRAFDGIDYGPEHEETLQITEVNQPPYPPVQISPTITDDTTPLITWSGAYDPDGNITGYYLAIGYSAGQGDIIDWLFVMNTWYQVGYDNPLPRGRTIYISLMATDGILNSTIFSDTITVTANANTPPIANKYPDEIYIDPVNLTIRWPEFTDVDGDMVTYTIAVGSEPNSTEVLDWKTITKGTNYKLKEFPGEGEYYLTVKASDSYGGETYIVVRVIASVPAGMYSDSVVVLTTPPTEISLIENETVTVPIEIMNNRNYDGMYQIDIEIIPECEYLYVDLRNGSVSGDVVSPYIKYIIGGGQKIRLYLVITRDMDTYNQTMYKIHVRITDHEDQIIGNGEFSIEVKVPGTKEKTSELGGRDQGIYIYISVAIIIGLIVITFFLKDKIVLFTTKFKAKREAELRAEVMRELHSQGMGDEYTDKTVRGLSDEDGVIEAEVVGIDDSDTKTRVEYGHEQPYDGEVLDVETIDIGKGEVRKNG